MKVILVRSADELTQTDHFFMILTMLAVVVVGNSYGRLRIC